VARTDEAEAGDMLRNAKGQFIAEGEIPAPLLSEESKRIHRKEYHQRYHIANKEKINARTRRHHFKRRYGITHKQVMELIKGASNKCQICGAEFSLNNKPHIDHDHKSNRIRGVLCRKCNSGIGLFDDKIDLLKRAIGYLQ
jgi:hypothetical protein